MQSKNKPIDTSILKDMFPGKEIPLGEHKIYVYPPGAIHVRKYTEVLYRIVRTVMSSCSNLSKDGKVSAEDMKNLITVLVPMIMDEGWNLLSECVEGVDLNDPRLPHYVLPQVIEAWIEISFTKEECIRPWIAALDKILTKVLGKQFSTWETISKFWSQRDTLFTKSTSSEEKDTLTQDGLSQNSGQESTPLFDSETTNEQTQSAT